MPGFEKAGLDEAYTIHSRKVLADAKKSLGLKSNSREYIDCLTMIFGNSTRLYRKLKDDPGEIVAYAVDYEACGRTNKLSRAIVERFGNARGSS